MGRNKALVEVDGTPMARRVADALIAAGCDPVMLVGGDPDELAGLGLPVLADVHPGAGPLGGVVSAMHSAGGDLLVVACDLPYLTPRVLASFVAAADASPSADVVVARTDRREPACVLWRPSSHSPTMASFESGERAVHRVLEQLRCIELPVQYELMRNVNTPDDLVG